MLSLATRDNWAGASADVTVGVTTHTWTCTAGVTTVLDAANDFVTWYEAQTWAHTCTPTFARNSADSGLKLTLTFSVSTALVPHGTATTLLGFGSASGTTVTASTSAAGTWAPKQAGGRISVALLYGMVQGTGDTAAAGAVRAGVPGHGLVKPTVEALGTAVDAARLTAVLAGLPTYRVGWFYRALDGAWLLLAVGTVQRTSVGRALYRFSFDAAG